MTNILYIVVQLAVNYCSSSLHAASFMSNDTVTVVLLQLISCVHCLLADINTGGD
jgi:hypothetical protein